MGKIIILMSCGLICTIMLVFITGLSLNTFLIVSWSVVATLIWTVGFILAIRDYRAKKINVPPDYKCKKCDATGCKLWRRYCSSCCELLCAKCAAADQKEDISDIGANGMHNSHLYTGQIRRFILTDAIGWYVPAVPDKKGKYFGHGTTPRTEYNWWLKLPTHP